MIKYNRNENVSTKEVDTEIFVFNRESGKMFSFSEVGKSIWKRLEHGSTIDDLLLAVTSDYDVEAPKARDDIKTFLDELCSKHLISSHEY
ncbi:MAG: PqqD family protein [Fibrobacterota bacterium]